MSGRWVCLALVGFSLTLGACGGASHGTGQTAASSTSRGLPAPAAKEKTAGEVHLVLQADALCQRLNIVLDLDKPKSNSLRETAGIAPGRAALEQSNVDKLRRLKVPASLASSWHEMLRLRASLAHELMQYGRAAAASDQAALAALRRSKVHMHQQLRAVGHAAGFNYCADVR